MTYLAQSHLRTRDQTIELALEAMARAIVEESLPRDVRREIALAHAHLHACRDPETVTRMERERGISQ